MKKAWLILLSAVLMLGLTACKVMPPELKDQVESLVSETIGENADSYRSELDAIADAGKDAIAQAGKDALEQIELPDEVEDAAEVVEDAVGTYREYAVEKRIKETKDSYGKRYTGSYQCKGFATMVFMDLFGDDATIPLTGEKPNNHTLRNTEDDGIVHVGSLTDIPSKTEEEIKAFFAAARPGDFIQMRRTHGGSHSAIVMSVSEKGMVWFEANMDNNNGIREHRYQWADFTANEAMSIYTAKDYKLAE